jgi:hypothetical protein
VLPLFVIGAILHYCHHLILRDQLYARFMLGLAASAAAPLFTVLSLIGVGAEPLLSWGSLWQWLVMAVGGGALTPVCFQLFDGFNRAFNYQPQPVPGFRPDREIKRDRGPHVDY